MVATIERDPSVRKEFYDKSKAELERMQAEIQAALQAKEKEERLLLLKDIAKRKLDLQSQMLDAFNDLKDIHFRYGEENPAFQLPEKWVNMTGREFPRNTKFLKELAGVDAGSGD